MEIDPGLIGSDIHLDYYFMCYIDGIHRKLTFDIVIIMITENILLIIDIMVSIWSSLTPLYQYTLTAQYIPSSESTAISRPSVAMAFPLHDMFNMIGRRKP